MRTTAGFLSIIFFGFVATLSSCVSVKLGSEPQKSKHVVYPELGNRYNSIDLSPADRAWKSSQTGNTIAYFSECGGSSASLERMRDDALSTLTQARILSSETIEHDDREALKSTIEGRLEGVPVKVSLLVYQKQGCRYTLSYSGRSQNFESELKDFEAFQRGFSAP